MNIIIFSPFSGSKCHGMVLRNYNWAREWVRQGHDVTIVASSFGHIRNSQPEVNASVTEEWMDGIRYLWILGPSYKQSGTLGRVFAMLVYTLRTLFLRKYLQKHYDIVVSSSPYPFSIYPAYRLAKSSAAKLVYDIRDLWPLTLILLGNNSPKHPFIRLVQKAENFACQHADLVTAVPALCEPYLQQHGLPPGRFLAVSNGICSENIEIKSSELPEQHQLLLTRLKSEDRFIVAYTGTLGLANAVHVIIPIISNLAEHIHLVIVGQGAYKNNLKDMVDTLNIKHRVHFLPQILSEQVHSFLKQIDLAYVGSHKSPLYEYGASITKLNDYMLAKKPILYAVGDPQNAVELSRAGISCEAENTEEITGALILFAKMSAQERAQMGERGYEWCLENQLVSKQVQKIIDALFA